MKIMPKFQGKIEILNGKNNGLLEINDRHPQGDHVRGQYGSRESYGNGVP
jgi:hypothetical protein